MHFVVNRACGSENKISSSLAALKSRTTIDDQVLAGETLSPSDIATQASPSIPLPPKRSSIRRLPRAVRARLKRRCQFEDSTSKSFIDEWIDRHKSSGCKRRRVVICSDEADDHSRLVSEDENSVTGGNRRVEKKNVAKDSRSKSRAAQSIDGSSNKIEPELPKNNASSNSDILPHTSEEDKPTIDKEGKNNLMTGDSTTGTRIVTPTPSEGEPSVCDEDAQETSCETSRADNSAKKPRTGHEEDYCNVLLYISRLSLNIRYPSDSKFADPVEEISEPTPERQAEKDKTGEGKGKRAKKEDSAGDKQSEEEVESQGMPTRDYPGASKPLSLLFQEKAAQEAKQRAEALAAADARQKLLVEESKAQASEKEPEVAELEVESTATEAPERMIIDKERGKDAVSSDEPEEEVATEVSSSSYATVSQPETSEKPIAKQPVEIVDLSVDTDSEIGDDDEAAFPSPTMTRQVAPMQQEARRVSQSPETARSSVRWSLSSEATETSDREEQEAEEDASFDFDENCLVGKCERIAKDPAMEAYLAGGAEELPPYPSEIYNYLWGKAEDEDNIGHTVEEVEESFAFRLANGKITKDVSTNQNKAMYGRITPSAMDVSFRDYLTILN